MAVATEAVPDVVMTLDVGPDPIEHYRLLRGGHLEGGPLIKCRPGRMTLVSPSKDHELADRRLLLLVMAVCSVLKIPCRTTGATLYRAAGSDHGYMPDDSFYLRRRTALAEKADTRGGPAPDLVIEIVNTHPADAALENCTELGVREVWVLDVPRGEFTIWQRNRTGTLVVQTASRVLPRLTADDVRQLLEASPNDEAAFDRAVRRWVKQVLVPRTRNRKNPS
jgi:Uma2 family endonuclease